MTDKTDATLAIIAALLVLFTTMLDPRLSAGLAVVLLVAFAVVKLVNSRADGRKPQR
jgi:flagellar biogenesis protein FliO